MALCDLSGTGAGDVSTKIDSEAKNSQNRICYTRNHSNNPGQLGAAGSFQSLYRYNLHLAS